MRFDVGDKMSQLLFKTLGRLILLATCLGGSQIRAQEKAVSGKVSITRGGGKDGRHCKCRDRKYGRDADVSCECRHDPGVPPQPLSGWSTIASRCWPRLKVTSAMPSSERSLSSATFIGPGEGAAPGAGCGKAVDMAV